MRGAVHLPLELYTPASGDRGLLAVRNPSSTILPSVTAVLFAVCNDRKGPTIPTLYFIGVCHVQFPGSIR